LHDVAPATQSACAEILKELQSARVAVCSLLVVPNYHQRGRSLEDHGFLNWLRMMQADGHELVVHGYYHQRNRRAGETLWDRLITRFYTADEGEFYDIGYDEALKLVSTAQNEFTAAGFKPRGFIAPAWLLSRESERAAAD